MNAEGNSTIERFLISEHNVSNYSKTQSHFLFKLQRILLLITPTLIQHISMHISEINSKRYYPISIEPLLYIIY